MERNTKGGSRLSISTRFFWVGGFQNEPLEGKSWEFDLPIGHRATERLRQIEKTSRNYDTLRPA